MFKMLKESGSGPDSSGRQWNFIGGFQEEAGWALDLDDTGLEIPSNPMTLWLDSGLRQQKEVCRNMWEDEKLDSSFYPPKLLTNVVKPPVVQGSWNLQLDKERGTCVSK